MDKAFVERVKEASDIVAIMAERGVKLKRAGSRMVALCPFHREKTPSFSVNPDLGLYYCFGCGASGDVIKFIMEFDGLDFPDAVKLLADRAGIPLPQNTSSSSDNKLFELTRFAMSFYHNALLSAQGTQALEYLKSRGLETRSVESFALGYAPGNNALLKAAHDAGFGVNHLAAVGLVSRNTQGQWFDFFRNRLVFPVFSASGRNVIGFSARALDDSQPKYLNSPETVLFKKSQVLFGFHIARKNIRKTGQALLVEGNMDVVLAHQAGFDNAVAPLGTAFTQQHAAILAKIAEKMIVAFDGDTAGLNAAKRALAPGLSAGLIIRFALLPEAQDPASLIASGQKAQLEKLLLNTVDVVEFVASRFHEPSQTEEILRDLRDVLSNIKDGDVLDLYLKRVQQFMGLSDQGIEVFKQRISIGSIGSSSSSKGLTLSNKEMFVVANGVVRANKPEFASRLEFLQTEDLSDPDAAKVLEHFKQQRSLQGLDQKLFQKVNKLVMQSEISEEHLARVFVPLVWELKLRGLDRIMAHAPQQKQQLTHIMIKKELAKGLVDLWRRVSGIRKTVFPQRQELLVSELAKLDVRVQTLWDQQELVEAYQDMRESLSRLYEMTERLNDPDAGELFRFEKKGDSVHG